MIDCIKTRKDKITKVWPVNSTNITQDYPVNSTCITQVWPVNSTYITQVLLDNSTYITQVLLVKRKCCLKFMCVNQLVVHICYIINI